MDTKRPSGVRQLLELAYAPPKAKPRYLREPYHVGRWFDVVVVLTCVAAAVAAHAA